jgi:hypothetical protein
MSRTVCGDCWALYDDAGKCECEEPALRRIGLPYCERSCEANAFQIEIRRLTGEVRMLQEQNTYLDQKLAQLERNKDDWK